MKHLTITFAVAVGLICVAIMYNKAQANENEMGTTTIAKTIVETDVEGKVTSELTMVIEGNRWVEKSKKEISYAQGCKTEVTYAFEDTKWIEVAKVVKSYSGEESLSNEVCYAMTDRVWVEKENKSYTDLSKDNGVLEDTVYDKDGNLIMSATYKWEDEEKEAGIEKTEYVYDAEGSLCRVVSYTWNGKSWNKEQVADMLYVSMVSSR